MRCWVLWIYINTLLATSWLVYHRNILSSWASLHCLVLSGTNNSVWPSHSSRQTGVEFTQARRRALSTAKSKGLTSYDVWHISDPFRRRQSSALTSLLAVPCAPWWWSPRARRRAGMVPAEMLSSSHQSGSLPAGTGRHSVSALLLPVLFVSSLSRGQAWP